MPFKLILIYTISWAKVSLMNHKNRLHLFTWLGSISWSIAFLYVIAIERREENTVEHQHWTKSKSFIQAYWGESTKSRELKKNDQHVDFPGGHPPEYYPRSMLLNFADRTGCGETTWYGRSYLIGLSLVQLIQLKCLELHYVFPTVWIMLLKCHL